MIYNFCLFSIVIIILFIIIDYELGSLIIFKSYFIS